ncbi:MAG: ABC transporter ATP-binding protein [Sporolactobacillus sp.]
MIQFEGVSKRYVHKQGLSEFTFQFESGHIIGVIGENGSGKSTLLKLAAGLLMPSKGHVLVDGERAKRRCSDKVAYLSELDGCYSFLTVAGTVDFHAATFAGFDRRKAEEMLDFMQLGRTQKVCSLSKGSRGRLKIVLALSRRVPYVLMDEPLSGLDPLVRQSIIRGLISFVDLRRQALILTTHELADIEPVLDTVILIKKGRLLAARNIDDVRREECLNLTDWMVKCYGE